VALFSSTAAVTLLYPAARSTALGRQRGTGGDLWGPLILALPLGFSSLALGTGLLHFKVLLPGAGSLPLLTAAHTALALPLAWRILGPAAASLPASLLRAGELHAPPLTRFFRIELPLLFPALASAAAFSFALSAGEVNAALLFSGPGFPTLPVTVYRLIGAYRYGEASALGTLLIATSFLALGFLELAGKRGTGEGSTAPVR
jgi:thiamine transport system permease protein